MKKLKRIRKDLLLAKNFSIIVGTIWGFILSLKMLLIFIVCMNPTNTTKIIVSTLLYVLTFIGVFFTTDKKKNICIISFINILFDTMLVFCILPLNY